MDSLAYIQAYLSGLRKRVKKQINFKNLFFGLLPGCNKSVFLVIFLFCWRKYISSIHSILCLRKYNLRAFPSRFVDLQENTVRLPCLFYSGDSCESCWSSTLGNFLKNTYCLKRAINSVELYHLLLVKFKRAIYSVQLYHLLLVNLFCTNIKKIQVIFLIFILKNY